AVLVADLHARRRRRLRGRLLTASAAALGRCSSGECGNQSRGNEYFFHNDLVAGSKRTRPTLIGPGLPYDVGRVLLDPPIHDVGRVLLDPPINAAAAVPSSRR